MDLISNPKDVIDRYEELNLLLQQPETLQDQNKIKDISSELKHLEEAYHLSIQHQNKLDELETAKELKLISTDTKESDSLDYQIKEYQELLGNLSTEIKKLLIPEDPDNKRNCILEIRSGTGGEEAALFANDLLRMYLRFAENNHWKIEILSTNRTNNGGIKEIILQIDGKNAFGKLRYESGVHRVQRIPSTESSGRLHTSAASVVVLPEVEEREVEIDDSDIKIDTFRSSGPGGQSVNTTDSAVRITHIPSGIVVTCQDEKSQMKNKAKAMNVLKSKLYDIEIQKKEQEASSQRLASIKGGDRSAKIRTYNYPQSRITDHRIGKSWYNLEEVLNGNLTDVVNTVKLELSQSENVN